MAKRKIKSKPTYVDPINSGLVDFMTHYNDDQKKEVVAYLNSFFKTCREMRNERANRWYDHYLMYRQYSQHYADRPSWQSAYYSPKGFEAIESVLAWIMQAITGQSPMLVGVPEREEFRPATKQVEMLLATRNHQTQRKWSLYTTLKQMLIYGTAIEKVVYSTNREYEGSEAIPLDIFDFYNDPFASSIASGRGCLDRNIMHIENIKDMETQDVWYDTDKIEKGGSHNYFTSLDRLRTLGYEADDYTEKSDYHEVLEFWGKWKDPETDEYFDVVATMVDRQHLVRLEECPYHLHDEDTDLFYAIKPYVRYLDVPSPKEFYGIGELEAIEFLVLEINDRRNAMMDAVQFNVSPLFQVLRGAVKDLDRIVFAPGNMVIVDEPDAMSPIKTDTTWMTGFTDINSMYDDIMATLGTYPSVTGAEGNIRTTATENLIKSEKGSQRRVMKVQLADGSISRVGEMQLKMEKQYTDTEVMAKAFGMNNVDAFVSLTPTQLKWMGTIKLKTEGASGVKALTAQQQMMFAEFAKGVPMIAERVNWPELAKGIGEMLNLDMDNILLQDRSPENPQQKPDLKLLEGGGGMEPGLAQQGSTTPITEQEAGMLEGQGATPQGGADIMQYFM